MSELTVVTIRRWVRSGIRRYAECVQTGMDEAEALDAAAWALLESETTLADRVVRNGISLYVQAVDDGISVEDAKEAAVAVVSDMIMGEQQIRRLSQPSDPETRVSWPDAMVTKAYAVDLVGRLVAGIAGPFDEFPVAFEGKVSPKEGRNGSEE